MKWAGSVSDGECGNKADTIPIEMGNMTVQRAFSIVVVSGLSFGAAGALVGFCIGWFVPDFYQLLFSHRIQPGQPVDFVAVGLAMGLAQGLMTGVGVGLVIILAISWVAGRRFSAPHQTPQETKNESW